MLSRVSDTSYSALTRPVPASERKAFRRWARESGWEETARPGISGVHVALLVVVSVFILLVFIGLVSFFTTFMPFDLGVIGPALVLVVVGVLALRGWRWLASSAASWEKHLRLREFAAARDSSYSGHVPAPSYPGMIFGIGFDRRAYDSVEANSHRALQIANYRYTVKGNEKSTVYRWGYLAMKLDRRLPHMVLDATSNNLIFGSNLPLKFDKQSVLSLEGDFDRYFTLYCPPEYARDALYVFSPDLMALLIDESSAFDVEIVDDWLFLYSTKPFDLLQPATWQRLDRIVGTVGAKTRRQTERYADERVAQPSLNIVAPQGRRLRRGIGPGALLALVGVVGWVGFQAWLNWI